MFYFVVVEEILMIKKYVKQFIYLFHSKLFVALVKQCGLALQCDILAFYIAICYWI